MKNLFFIALTTLLFFSACKGKKDSVSNSMCDSCEDAIIRFYGEPALDGCGWVVDVSSEIYMPTNLLPEYQQKDLPVKIKYKVLERVNCGLVKDKYPSMLIEEIYKK